VVFSGIGDAVTVEMLVWACKGSGSFAVATTVGAEVIVLFAEFVSSSGRRASIRERVVGSIKPDSPRNSSSYKTR